MKMDPDVCNNVYTKEKLTVSCIEMKQQCNEDNKDPAYMATVGPGTSSDFASDKNAQTHATPAGSEEQTTSRPVLLIKSYMKQTPPVESENNLNNM